MKKFTKAALILTLVMVLVGSVLCAVGFGVGFRYGTIRNLARDGIFSFTGNFWDWEWDDDSDYSWDNDSDYDYDTDYKNHDSMYWKDAKTEEFGFSKQEIESLDLDVYYGEVVIEESPDADNIKVIVKYKNENHKRNIDDYVNDKTLVLEETGRKGLRDADNIKVTIQIPAGMEFKQVNLKNHAGLINVNTPVLANIIDIQIDAGECNINQKLTAREKLYAAVGAGELDTEELETVELSLKTGVGAISTGIAQADDVTINCSVGQIETIMAGSEVDYSYNIDCGIGDVEIGENTYSGLGTSREVKNSGRGNMEISCGVGEVNVEFNK